MVRVDEKGRVLIPKSVRYLVELKERQLVRVEVAGNKIVLEPLGDVADKYYGVVEIRE